MTYVIAQPCVDVKDRACVDECPVDCIYEGERSLYEEWEDYTRANIDFFELKGLGSPGGAQGAGVQDYDDPMIAALPPQNEEWKEANGY